MWVVFGEIGVLIPILQCSSDYTLGFINFVILPLLFTSRLDFTAIQCDSAPILTVDYKQGAKL